MIFSTQLKIGEVGSKPVTVLKYQSAGPYMNLVAVDNKQYGANVGGVWQLNYTDPDGQDTDDGLPIIYSAVFNSSDLGSPFNLKKLRYIYVSAEAPGGMQVLTSKDSISFCKWKCKRVPQQRGFRQAVYNGDQSLYWSIGVESTVRFTLFSAQCAYILRSSGVSNG